MKRNQEKRKVTYTVTLPIRFSFLADNDLTLDEFYEVVKSELNKRLEDGYFDILPEEYCVVNKVAHYTREEKLAQNRVWNEILSNMLNRGLRRWFLHIQDKQTGIMTT